MEKAQVFISQMTHLSESFFKCGQSFCPKIYKSFLQLEYWEEDNENLALYDLIPLKLLIKIMLIPL